MTHNVKDTIMIDTWDSCYNLSWKGIITAESFSHPAKFSHALIRRIYQHIIAEGWVKQGDVILDPFGGVGLGGLYAAQNGLQWVGCELEQKFVGLGQQNIALWESKFASGFPRWVTPVLLQGDSRKLCQVIGQATAVMKSPPFVDTEPTRDDNFRYNGKKLGSTGNHYGNSPGQLGQMSSGDISAIISSPPFAGNSGGRGEASRNGIDAALFDRHSGGMKKGTGESEGNLDHLPMGSVAAVIGSPPYENSFSGNSENPEITRERMRQNGYSEESISKVGDHGHSASLGYGSTDGQLGSMSSGNIQAIISSPPFADSVGSDDPDKRGGLYRDPKRRNDVNLSGTYGDTEGQLGAMRDGGIAALDSSRYGRKSFNGTSDNYGQSPNQLGNESGETFWQAAAAIVQQCAMVLPSGGHAIWVTKRYIKNGRIVDFTAQWIQLCEALGFRLLHHHKALLVKDNGSQSDMFGKDQENRTERKSFFRILHESKQKAAIHWETLGNSDRATLLALAYVEAFKAYQVRLAKNGKAPGITTKRVKGIAQMTGWKRDGKPYYDTSTAIDNEDVLCFVRL